MTGPIGKACLLLASADLSARELQAFALWVEKRGARGFVDTIEDLRELASGESIGIVSDNAVDGERSRGNRYSDLSAKVERSLVNETGLSRREAAEVLRTRLKAHERSYGNPIPDLGRRSFRD
jgi:hypothetical protein